MANVTLTNRPRYRTDEASLDDAMVFIQGGEERVAALGDVVTEGSPFSPTQPAQILFTSGEPSSDVGSEGDVALDTASGDVWSRAATEWRRVYIAPRPQAIRFGADAPSNDTGSDGDVYVNTTTGAVSMRVSGSYVLQVTLTVKLPE